jgi:hypothetical protein
MMKLSEFARRFPIYAVDFERQLREQPRTYDGAALDQFPTELEPDHPYQAGSRGRPNPNQTLVHSQCATCHRVRRNDFFYTVPSMMKRNVVFPHCRECNQGHNAARYETRAEVIRARREALWRFFAPRCAACGFDQHMSALELHHTGNKDAVINELMTSVTLVIDAGRVEALLRGAAQCVPLCSNCHRMVHAGALTAVPEQADRHYHIAEILSILKSCG